jgi:hypothetical protein
MYILYKKKKRRRGMYKMNQKPNERVKSEAKLVDWLAVVWGREMG